MQQTTHLSISIIITILCITPIFAQNDPPNENHYINSTKIDGLYIYLYPSEDSTRVAIVPYGQRVIFIDQSGIKESINGFSGEWIEIQYNDFRGYIFDAYTSQLPMPYPDVTKYSSIFHYLNDNFEKTGGNKDFHIDNADMELYNETIKFGNINYTFSNEDFH